MTQLLDSLHEQYKGKFIIIHCQPTNTGIEFDVFTPLENEAVKEVFFMLNRIQPDKIEGI